MNNIKNKKILILGFSVTGIACAKYFANREANVYISEYNEQQEKNQTKIEELKSLGIKIEFNGHSEDFICNSDFCILSPSIPTDAPILKKLEEKNIPYFSDIEYVSKNENEKIVLITGTNGKTTTTALTSHILSKKFNAPYCGNIGVSPMEYKDKNIDYYVVEASSYQLNYSPTLAPRIGIFTNLTPDHILWHKTIENYFEAKAKPFRAMDEKCHAILNYDDSMTKKLGEEIKAQVYYFSLTKQNIKNCIYLENNEIVYNDEKIINVNELQIVGPHNIQNAMCSILSAIILGLDVKTIKEALKSFKAIEHRLEFIRTIEDTDYYNDSKATNPEASFVAVKSFEGKSLSLILGGRDKNTDLTEFCTDYINKYVSTVILIGEATQRFKENMEKNGFTNIILANSLEEAVDISLNLDTQVVLLSPACASYDMFNSYEHRGEVFKNYVHSKL